MKNVVHVRVPPGAGAVDTFVLGAGERQESKQRGVVRIATATPTCGSGTRLRNCKEVGQPRGRFFHPIDYFVMAVTAAAAIARQTFTRGPDR
jgi:hypothetical protein